MTRLLQGLGLLVLAGSTVLLAAELLQRRGVWMAERADSQAARCRAVADLRTADRLSAGDPRVLEAFALAIARRPQLDPDACPMPSPLQLFDRAVRARRTWPPGHLRLALAHATNGEFGAPFLVPFMKAQELGPWEPGVQRISVRLLDGTWPLQSELARRAAARAAERLVDAGPEARDRAIFERIRASRHRDAWCDVLDPGRFPDCAAGSD